jgi:pimeloyl-ACP methyl ester carboxylesterase
VGQTEYAFIEDGEGPLLLLGHGTFGGKELFLPQIERLSRHFRCVAFDWPGHGETTFGSEAWGVDALVEDVPGLIDGLGCRTAYLAGVSQGGAVFMRVALRHPERVDGLVNMCAGPGGPPPAALSKVRAFAASLHDEPDEAARRAAAQEFVNDWFHAPGFAEAQPEAARREIEVILAHPREGVRLAAGVPASYVSIEDELATLACPTLVIWAEHDLRPRGGAEIAAAIPGAKLAVIEGAGHHVNVDAPAETAAIIEQFLCSLP